MLRALARFGAGRLGPPPEPQALSPRRAVLSLVAPFHVPEPSGERFHTRLHVDGKVFDVVTDGPDLSLRQRDDEPDLELELSVSELLAARHGSPAGLPSGADRFARLFELA